MQDKLFEAGAPVGFINSLISLNPFGRTKKIIDLMKEVNQLKLNIVKEKGEYNNKLKVLLDKYLVGQKISVDQQEALKKEYKNVIKKSLSEYGKELKLNDKSAKDLVDQIFKAEEDTNLIFGEDKQLEKIPDINKFKEAIKDKIDAMNTKADALLSQAKELSNQGTSSAKDRTQALYASLKNWIMINASNEALKYAEEKEKEAIKSSIKIREDLSTKLIDRFKDLDLKKDTSLTDKDEKESEHKSTVNKDQYVIDFDYTTYSSTAGLSESDQQKIASAKKSFEKDKDNNLSNAEELKNEYQTLIRNTIDGGSRGFIVFGKGGLGKSFSVEKFLEKKGLEQDKDYILIKGAASPSKVFQKMRDNPDKLFIFDDADSLWNSQEGKNLLKGALDT